MKVDMEGFWQSFQKDLQIQHSESTVNMYHNVLEKEFGLHTISNKNKIIFALVVNFTLLLILFKIIN